MLEAAEENRTDVVEWCRVVSQWQIESCYYVVAPPFKFCSHLFRTYLEHKLFTLQLIITRRCAMPTVALIVIYDIDNSGRIALSFLTA